jgi:hypothetical protein
VRLVWGSVTALDESNPRALVAEVELDDGTNGPAVCYPALTGACAPGDRVLLNTTAVDLDLGTGGVHFVVAIAGEGVVLDTPSGGHVMKLRYTPLQVDVLSAEEPASPAHQTMRTATDLHGMPVVCCGLHSQVPLVAAAIKQADPGLRVAYCMADFAALPLALSRVMAESTAAGLVDATVTCGQSFGGDHEAVNLHSGLLAARYVAGADIAIVAIGPGVVGTATPFGHGGVAQGEAINATATLGGVPVACLRISFADERERHRVVSHHTLTALRDVALAPAHVAIPTLPAEFADAIDRALDEAGVWARHTREQSSAGEPPSPAMRGVEVRTMGRGIAEDPAFFSAAFAAGDIASRIARGVL